MCGIVGTLRWQQPDPEALILQMTRLLAHRGPDSEKVVQLGPLLLGHRRLSIIETSYHSIQPMCDSSQRYWIVFNGEIYNYRSLRSELKNLGHSFITESDTEVILESWKRWGSDCLAQLQGMFVFALWDKLEERLFIARDRLGEKPLYYKIISHHAHQDNDIVFASELKSLRLHPSIGNTLNYKAMSQFLSLNYTLTDACILEGVEKLPPAHYLMLQRGHAPQLKCYWQLSHFFKQKRQWSSIDEAAEECRHLITQSVKQQMISDVPLGAFLSGGMDSSTLVAAMTQITNPHLTKTFSMGFHEKTFSELNESKQVADFLNVDHHTQMVDVNMAELLPSLIQSMDEPFADSSLIPTYFLAEFAKKHVTVSLSGDGGDELFLGYETYTADKMYRLMQWIPKNLLSLFQNLLDKYMPVSHQKISLDYKLKQFLKGCQYDSKRAHYFWRVILSDTEKMELLNPEIRSSILAFDPFDSFNSFYKEVENCHPLDQASYVDIKTWLVDDILVKVDRATMAHSLESRAPFLDHRLVEFAASLPPEWKMKGFQKKYLLKLSQQSILPNHILKRAKKGFNAPISSWFSGKLQTLGQEITLDPSFQQWFCKPAIELLWKEHLANHRDHGLKLFGLTCFGLWLHHSQKALHKDTVHDLRHYSSV